MRKERLNSTRRLKRVKKKWSKKVKSMGRTRWRKHLSHRPVHLLTNRIRRELRKTIIARNRRMRTVINLSRMHPMKMMYLLRIKVIRSSTEGR